MSRILVIAASTALLTRTVVADDIDPPWVNPDGGNVQVEPTGPGPIFTGTVVPADILDTLHQHCDTLTCSAEPWTMDTTLDNTGAGTNGPTNVNPGTITISVTDATINQPDNTDAMIDLLKLVAQQPSIFNNYTATPNVDCDYSDVPVAPGKRHARDIRYALGRRQDDSCGPFQQYSTASTFYIRTNTDDNAVRSELRVDIKAIANDAGLDVCKDLAKAGQTVAGAIPGVGSIIGAGLSLGGLLCGA